MSQNTFFHFILAMFPIFGSPFSPDSFQISLYRVIRFNRREGSIALFASALVFIEIALQNVCYSINCVSLFQFLLLFTTSLLFHILDDFLIKYFYHAGPFILLIIVVDIIYTFIRKVIFCWFLVVRQTDLLLAGKHQILNLVGDVLRL